MKFWVFCSGRGPVDDTMASVQPVNDITKPVLGSTDSGDESDDAYDEVVEVSPCNRWEKRRIEVSF